MNSDRDIIVKELTESLSYIEFYDIEFIRKLIRSNIKNYILSQKEIYPFLSEIEDISYIGAIDEKLNFRYIVLFTDETYRQIVIKRTAFDEWRDLGSATLQYIKGSNVLVDLITILNLVESYRDTFVKTLLRDNVKDFVNCFDTIKRSIEVIEEVSFIGTSENETSVNYKINIKDKEPYDISIINPTES